jgi:hypothetical protein
MRTTPSRFAAYAEPAEDVPAPRTDPSAAADAIHDERSLLERQYPAVTRALTLLWGYPEMNQYFEKAWGGQDTSLDLDPAAMSELMTLAAVHRYICPYKPAVKVADIYGDGRRASTWEPARSRR